MGAGEGSEDDSTDSTTEGVPEMAAGTTDETDEGGTDEGETGSDPSECYGDGESLDHDAGRLEPTSHDDEVWDWQTVRVLNCVVAALMDPPLYDTWELTLACEGEGLSLDLDWRVPTGYGLVDAGWAGKSLSVVAAGGQAGPYFRGWAVVRDEQGELVWISASPSLPDPEWTDPVSIEVLDLGDDCTLVDDECYPVYANVVLFDSPLDGELRSYRGSAHQTEHFTYVGESTTYESYWDPFGSECRTIYDYYVGRWDEVRVVRRP